MATDLPPDDKLASLSDSHPVEDVDRDPFEELASEFADRQRNGEFPSVEDYAQAHPDLAEEIRELFPTIAAMEQLKQRKSPAPKPTLGGLPLEQLGDFRILGEIGRGGMGVVYEAEQVSLGRRVAVKVLPKQALLDERHLRRFEREAQTAAKLHHTNIVPVFGVGQQDGYHYIVMQFIPGVGLDEILVALRALVLDDNSCQFRIDSSSRASHASHNARALLEGNFTGAQTGGFSSFHKQDATGTERLTDEAATVAIEAESSPTPADALSPDTQSLDADASRQLARMDDEFYRSIARIGNQVADALAYAHEQGTLHRDIKPGNLLLDGTGTVWVADFGLAKLSEHDNVSRTGDIVGTLSYMPPESFSGETDGRSDVYALGLTLFEMLVLRPAFFGRDRGKLVKQITEGDLPRLSKLNPSIPRDLETIVLKAVAHRPEDRYSTARELEEDLQRFLDDAPILARRMSVPEQFVRWCRKNKLVASLAASVLSLLVITAGVIIYSAEQRAKRQAEQAASAQTLAEQQTQLAQSETQRATEAALAAEKERKAADEQRRLRQEAVAARENSKQTTNEALGALLVIIDRLFPNRLPLSANQSLEVTEASEELTATDEETTEENAATVAPPPITEETAASLAVVLETFSRLAQRAENDELGITFAELTLRVGKLQKMLGKNEEAVTAFDNAIALFEAARTKHPQTAVIGLAMSHNEKGDVLVNSQRFDWSSRRAAQRSYQRALKLFEDNDELLADSHRAQYEKARTLFLMSVQPVGFQRGGSSSSHGPGRPGRGGPGGPGSRGGSNRGGPSGPSLGANGRSTLERMRPFGGYRNRLQEAIDILVALTEQEDDPEYTYLLARCYTGLSITAWGDHRVREASIQRAMTLLHTLVHDHPYVADYKFEYAMTQLRSLEILRRAPATEADVITEVVKLVDEIATRNPGVWNYAMLHVMTLVKQAKVKDRHANQLARKGDAEASRLRMETLQATDRAAEVMEQTQARFPTQFKSFSNRFGRKPFAFFQAGVQAKAGQHQEAAKSYRAILADLEAENKDGGRSHRAKHEVQVELARALLANGELAEVSSMLTPVRSQVMEQVELELERVESHHLFGVDNRRFHELLRLMTKVESVLKGDAGARSLLTSMCDRRLAAIKDANENEDVRFERADLDVQKAMCLRDIEQFEQADQLLERIEGEMREIRASLQIAALESAPREERHRQLKRHMRATRILFKTLELGDRALLEKTIAASRKELEELAPLLPDILRFLRPGRGGPRGPRGPRSEGRGNREERREPPKR